MLERHVAHYRFRIIVCEELEHANAPHLVGLLCMRGERPRDRAAEKPDELASSHSTLPEPQDQAERDLKDTTTVTRCRGVAMTAVGQTRSSGAIRDISA